jgi:hypothetical protein
VRTHGHGLPRAVPPALLRELLELSMQRFRSHRDDPERVAPPRMQAYGFKSR